MVPSKEEEKKIVNYKNKQKQNEVPSLYISSHSLPATMATPPDSSSVEDQMQEVFALVTARSRGQASDKQVEAAVARILSNKKSASNTPRQQQEHPVALHQADMEDYDDLEDEDTKQPATSKKPPPNITSSKKRPIDDIDQQNNEHDEDYQEALARIPLGKQGAYMITSFGAGSKPPPEVVSAALLATRKCIQMAIQDARALRRKQKHQFATARAALSPRKQKKPQLKHELDPHMLYRAISGYDALAYAPKCGFTIEQLQDLFPEEMNAYQRWKKMHAETKEKQEGAEALQGEADQRNPAGAG